MPYDFTFRGPFGPELDRFQGLFRVPGGTWQTCNHKDGEPVWCSTAEEAERNAARRLVAYLNKLEG
jgi:hypothetical protein